VCDGGDGSDEDTRAGGICGNVPISKICTGVLKSAYTF